MLLLCLGLLAALGMALDLSAWSVGLTAAAALWYLLDIAAICYRRAGGLYGTTEIEALEAARYVIRSRRRGGGGGFDTVFDESPRRAGAPAPSDAAPEGARS